MAAKKTATKTGRVSPISREQFRQTAPNGLAASIADFPMSAGKKEFATGSLGWYGNGKVTLTIGGVPVDCQVGITVAIIGSKELPA